MLAVTAPQAREPATVIIHAELDAIDRACSRFRDDSELAIVNRSPGRWIEASALFRAALAVALTAAETTDGVVDPTMGRALRILGYDRDFESVAAAGDVLRIRVEQTPGWRAVEIDHAARRVRIPRGVELDLGATAKAFAADRVARRIATKLDTGVIVSLGGDCAIAGPVPVGGWTIRVTDRHDAPDGAPGATIALESGGLATSGTTARRWTRGERELHHVIDPSTGWSAAPVWRTASVVAASCVDANVASTAAIVLGDDARAWLLTRRVPARLVAADGSVTTLGGWPAEMASVTSGHSTFG